jgi:hypothetical protein
MGDIENCHMYPEYPAMVPLSDLRCSYPGENMNCVLTRNVLYRPTVGITNEEMRDANCMFNRFWQTLREIQKNVRGYFVYPEPEPLNMVTRYAKMNDVVLRGIDGNLECQFLELV